MITHNNLPPCQQLALAIAVGTKAGPQLFYHYPTVTTYTQPLVYNTPVVYKIGRPSFLPFLLYATNPAKPAFIPRSKSGRVAMLATSSPNLTKSC